MLLFYIRHGDPDYSVDGLTPRGARQAEAVGRRLSTFGMDKIYTSPLGRAKLTAQPTCELLGKEAEVVEWASEANAWHATTVPTGEGDRRTWAFHHAPTRELFARVADLFGFSSPSYFYYTFKRLTGMTPTQYFKSVHQYDFEKDGGAST